MALRPYQQEAVDKIIDWVTSSIDPCLIEAATGAGKSHIVSAVAHWINKNTGNRVLCLAPSKELTIQNHEKYSSIEPASIFGASAGSKSTKYPVVFGLPVSVKNSIRRFQKGYSAVIIDEAHGITNTIKYVIDKMRESNPYLRVIGMTATPYRTKEGYIYQIDENGRTVPEDEAYEPYFMRLLYRITAPELIDMGYLSPPTTEVHEGYDTSKLEKDRTGKFTSESIEMVFEGQGRKTAHIVADVVESSQGRKGVMFFAASLAHADEIMASLPSDNARLVHGQSKDRDKIISDFKAQKFKYIVNRDVLTTGFDAPHVDVIAILRRTESASLLQQIIGRGMRLAEGKKDFLVLDYAENLQSHFPDGDIFKPEIKAKVKKESGEPLRVICPDCEYENEFTARPNFDQFKISNDGYFVDLSGIKMDMPAHFGRRCFGFKIGRDHQHHRCQCRWTSKECPECGKDNDIAARFCEHCKAEIIDPNEKLKLEFQKIKASPSLISTDKVLAWKCREHLSQKGNKCLLVDWTTEYRTFPVYYHEKSAAFKLLSDAVFNGHIAPSAEVFIRYIHKGTMPKTITSHRPKGQPFFKVLGYNGVEDEIPS